MTKYRISRNLEKSLIDFIEDKLSENEWSNVRIEKGFARIYEGELPAICVRVSDSIHNKLQIGNNTTYRTPLILIDIFTKSDGQRLDIKDCLVDELRNGFIYYEYIIENGEVKEKKQTSRVTIITLTDEPIDLDVEKQNLDVKDRYRHLLSLNCRLGVLEE